MGLANSPPPTLTIVLLVTLLLPASAFAALTDNIYAHWDFEDISTQAEDITGQSHTGAISGSPESSTACIVGNCIGFDGTAGEYITDSFSASALTGGTTEFTICHWINTTDTDGQIWGTENFVLARTTSTNINIVVYGGAGATVGGTLNDGTWHHICWGFEGTSGFYSVDGASKTTFTDGGSNTDTTVKMAQRAVSATRPYGGWIDQFSHWERALSNDEIDQLYTAESAGYSYPWLTVGLNHPSNETVTNNVSLDMRATTTDPSHDECYLYTNSTGTMERALTNSSFTGGNVIFSNLTNFIDTSYEWGVICNSTSSGITRASTHNYTFTYDGTAPSVNLTYPALDGSTRLSENLTMTLNVSDLHLSWVYVEVSNNTERIYDKNFSSNDNTLLNISPTINMTDSGTYYIKILSSDSLQENLTNVTYKYNASAVVYEESYSASIFNNVETTFTFNMTFDTQLYPIALGLPNATLVFNESDEYLLTPYNHTLQGFVKYEVNLTPVEHASNTTVYHNWTIEFPSETIYTSNQEQTAWDIAIGACNISPSHTVSMIVSSYNEESPSNLLNTTLELNIELWLGDKSSGTSNYSVRMKNNQTHEICISPYDSTVYADVYMKYTTIDELGFTHRYYIYNGTFTNETSYVSVYNFNETTGISDLDGTIRNFDNYNVFPAVIGKLQRYYPSENAWRTVQMDRSGEFGKVFYNIREEDTDYRFIFSDEDNNVLKTTDTLKFVCQNTICVLTFLVSPYASSATTQDLDYNVTFNNVTNMVKLNFTDPTGVTRAVRLLVQKETLSGTTEVCNEYVQASQGILDCNLTGQAGTFSVGVYASASPEIKKYLEWIRINVAQPLSTLIEAVGTNEGMFWALGIMTTAMLGGAAMGAVGLIVMTIFSFISVYFTGLVTWVTLSTLAIVFTIGLVIVAKVRK